MRDAIQKVDYVGFTFGGLHSSQFGLKSVSSGNRYTRNLLPATEVFSADISGRDGNYFFGTRYKNRTIPIDLAFDDVSEQELREIILWLHGDNSLKPLILDELPYVQYYVRSEKQPQLKYIVFDGSDGARVYKGELSLEFIAYDPYGYSVYKWLNNYIDENVGEWSSASGMLMSSTVGGAAFYDTYSAGKIPLYNPGDVATDYILTLTIVASAANPITIGLTDENPIVGNRVNLSGYSYQLDFTDEGIGTVTVNTQKRLITYVANATPTVTEIKNDALIAGNLFLIPAIKPNLRYMKMTLTAASISAAFISYSYKYL